MEGNRVTNEEVKRHARHELARLGSPAGPFTLFYVDFYKGVLRLADSHEKVREHVTGCVKCGDCEDVEKLLGDLEGK